MIEIQTKKNTETYIDASYERQKDIDNYEIHIKLT